MFKDLSQKSTEELKKNLKLTTFFIGIIAGAMIFVFGIYIFQFITDRQNAKLSNTSFLLIFIVIFLPQRKAIKVELEKRGEKG